MGLKETLFHTAGKLMLDRGSRSFEEHAAGLESACGTIMAHISGKAGSDRNRAVLSHIIGIERWSQRRLRVALGEPFAQEEYNRYRPARETTWDTLKTEFEATRRESIALARQLSRGVQNPAPILHNDFGPLSARGWLNYIRMHASMESKKIR